MSPDKKKTTKKSKTTTTTKNKTIDKPKEKTQAKKQTATKTSAQKKTTGKPFKETKKEEKPVKKETTKPEIKENIVKEEKEEKTPVKTKKVDSEKKQKIFGPKIEKITINIGVGEAGERLTKAETVLKGLTGHISVKTLSKTTNKDWGLRKRMPIGCKVTLRGKDANNFLTEALKTRENKIADYAFDEQGNLSFGIPDHTLFKNQKYDPKIGIFGMDVSITMKRAGYRVKKRRIAPGHIPKRHQVKKEETMQFFQEQFNAEVIE